MAVLDLGSVNYVCSDNKMTIEKLERVMWRLRKENVNTSYPTNNMLKLAIMQEIGTDIRTYKANRKALIALGWLKTHNKKRLLVTNKDITG